MAELEDTQGTAEDQVPSSLFCQLYIHRYINIPSEKYSIYTILLRGNVYVSFTATKMFFLESAT